LSTLRASGEGAANRLEVIRVCARRAGTTMLFYRIK
jgi:hypothetical protein